HKSTYFPAPTILERTYPALVVLEEQRGLGAPLGALTTLLAQTLEADFGDTVLVVHAIDNDDRRHPDSIQTDPRRVDRLWMPIPADPTPAAELLHERLRSLGESYAYVFLDTSPFTPDFTRVIVSHLASADLGEMIRRLIFLTKERTAPHFSPGW